MGSLAFYGLSAMSWDRCCVGGTSDIRAPKEHVLSAVWSFVPKDCPEKAYSVVGRGLRRDASHMRK